MTTKRERPTADLGEREQMLSTLDEMESRAKANVKGGSRVTLASKLKLEWANQEKGFYYYWATDSESYPVSLQQMLDAGYTFVRHEAGISRGKQVIKNSKGCNLYLMRQADEYREADNAIKNAKAIAQHKEIMNVGSREYAGRSKELGQGKVAELTFEETPDAIKLMTGE